MEEGQEALFPVLVTPSIQRGSKVSQAQPWVQVNVQGRTRATPACGPEEPSSRSTSARQESQQLQTTNTIE